MEEQVSAGTHTRDKNGRADAKTTGRGRQQAPRRRGPGRHRSQEAGPARCGYLTGTFLKFQEVLGSRRPLKPKHGSVMMRHLFPAQLHQHKEDSTQRHNAAHQVKNEF